ncbi:hypothetical protein OIY81_2090 [Cryptosporidium canis]|nr:hypothetical protein OIY81_2090 [Cryptosporidium canis]
MKVKVILRAPKSQIPLYMTLNDAKFGNEEVTTSLNVIESDEVVHWVNNTNGTIPSSLQIAPQKQLEISEDLARSISSSLSEILKNKNLPRKGSENRIRDIKNSFNLSSIRHKYKDAHIKDAIAGKGEAESAEKNEGDDFKGQELEDTAHQITPERPKDEKIEKLERLLSHDLSPPQSSGSSSMGALVGSKYNGKELKSNLRKKYLRTSNAKSVKNPYDYNKKFRSNDEFPDWQGFYPVFDDMEAEDSPVHDESERIIQEKIQNEIDNATKMESIQCEIAKTFKNLTLSPCLCKGPESIDAPYDRNQVIFQKRLFLNELHEKVPTRYSQNYVSPKNNSHNMYLLIHGSGEEFKATDSPKNAAKSKVPINSPKKDCAIIEKQHRNSQSPKNPHCPSETPKTNGSGTHDNEEHRAMDSNKNEKSPKSQLSQALSRLSLELSNANSILDQCMKEKEDIVSSLDEAFIKDLQGQLDSLGTLYRKMQIKDEDSDVIGNENDKVTDSHWSDDRSNIDSETDCKFNLAENFGLERSPNIDSNKVPNTNLPLLNEVSYQRKNGVDLPSKRLPIQRAVHSYYENPPVFQGSNKLESKRSISVPAHEKFLDDHHSQYEKNTKSIGEIPYINEIQGHYKNKDLMGAGNTSNVNNSNLATNKPPQSKIGLKPNSSSERLSLEIEEKSRGRARSHDNIHPRTATRDFVAENKSNVALNAIKSSSSLLQSHLNKKGTRLLKKKSSIGRTHQNPPTRNDEAPSRFERNHNHNQNLNHHLHPDEFNSFNSRNEIYPSLEVGGPIARMNGTCGGFVPCFQGSYFNGHYDPHFTGFSGNYHGNNNYPKVPHFHQPNYQRVNNYIGANGLLDSKTPRCPYWCNLICKI